MKNTIIYLIGFAGVGKFTIAKELSKLIGTYIVDNHLINNPILSLIPLDGKTPIPKIVWNKIDQVREAVFTTIEDVSPKKSNFIFTNELLQSSQHDRNIYNRITAIAKKRRSVFVPIRLICGLNELCKRVVREERALKFKMTDIGSTKEKYENESILMPDSSLTRTLDVTNLSANQAAHKIVNLIKNRL